MDTLLDLVCIKDAADDPQTKAMQSPGVVRLDISLLLRFSQLYFNKMFSQNLMYILFVNTILPPNITIY